MPTTKKRILITLTNPLERALEILAKRDHTPKATKAAHLLQAALEIEEDYLWDYIAAKRDTRNARFVSHKKAWA